jgi:hypothetical protein
MESRLLTPLLSTLFAALAAFYPIVTATGNPAKNLPPETNVSRGKVKSPEGPSARTDFPTAKDLVSKFFSRDNADHATSSSHAWESDYHIDFLIATLPDPGSSHLPRFFDSFVESLERAAEASGYT